MVDVMFFSYRCSDAWWRYLAEQLDFTQSTCLVSDVRNVGDINIVDAFYTNMRNTNGVNIAIKELSHTVCDEIIQRCRVLRNLKKNKALSMIGAMFLTISDLVEKQKPRLVVCFVIDRYVLDVFDRVLKKHGIRFLSMTASIVPDYVMFMDRGKLVPLRKPQPAEIKQTKSLLTSEKFIPTYVANKKFSSLRYWTTFGKFKLRGLAYQFIRYAKRDPLNLHYLDALNSLSHKPRFGDYVVMRAFDRDWEAKLQRVEREKRVFVGLQLLPEASLDYWLDDLQLLNNEESIYAICKTLGEAGYTVFVKDHPLQFGFRKRALIQKLLTLPYVVMVPYEVTAGILIRKCSVTVAFTGTIGFEAALAGSCAVVSGAYYSDESHFVHFHNRNDIAALPDKIATFKKKYAAGFSTEGVDGLVEKLLAASAPGDLFGFSGFDKEQAESINKTTSLIQSLNKYLPQFLTSSGE